jgi:hypothetical protein
MPCLFGRGEAERAELRDLLESANSQREEYRKAADAASRRAEHLALQLEARLLELQELSGAYGALQQQASRAARDADALTAQVAGYKQSLGKAATHQEDLNRRLQKEATARKAAEADLRKLHKEREYLKMRVDRMQHALSILESVMDDTLRVSQGAGCGEGGGGLRMGGGAAALRQSMGAGELQQLQDLIAASKLGSDRRGHVDGSGGSSDQLAAI